MAAYRRLGAVATLNPALVSQIRASSKLAVTQTQAVNVTPSSTAVAPQVDECGMPIPPTPQVFIGDYFSVPEPDLKKAIAANTPITFAAAVTPAAEAYVNAKYSDISAAMTKRQLSVMAKGSRQHLNPAVGVVTAIPGLNGLGAIEPPTRTSPIPPPSTRPVPPPSTRPLPPGTITPSTVITPETKFPPTMLPSSIPPINDPNFLKPSIDTFLKYNTDFALSYKGLNVPVKPTVDEMTKQGGLTLLIKRGGYLMYKPVMDGTMPIAATEPPQETENYVWGVFVTLVTAGALQTTASAIAKITGMKNLLPTGGTTKAVYSVKMRRLTRSLGRVISEWSSDAVGFLKSSIKWLCGKVTNDKLQTASNYGAAYAGATGPGVVYVAGAVAAWKGAAAACGYAWPKPSAGADNKCLTKEPEMPQIPVGSIAYFDGKNGLWSVAVPPPGGVGLYLERGAEATLPVNAEQVSIWHYQKLTRPWYRRYVTFIIGGAALVGAGSLTGGILFGGNHKALPPG